MSGGEKIISRIKSDCDERIRTIEAAAQKQYDTALEEARRKAEAQKAEAMKTAEKKVKQIRESSVSRAQLEIRNAVLKTKREEIDITLTKLLDRMLDLDDGEYFETIYKLASQLKTVKVYKAKGLIDGAFQIIKDQIVSEPEDRILLNQRDLDRLPDDFETRFRELGIHALVSRKPVDIKGGFILKRGDVEENMDFSAIISARRDELEDLINRELFVG